MVAALRDAVSVLCQELPLNQSCSKKRGKTHSAFLFGKSCRRAPRIHRVKSAHQSEPFVSEKREREEFEAYSRLSNGFNVIAGLRGISVKYVFLVSVLFVRVLLSAIFW